MIPPGPDGQPWRIATRQFRRTFAWHIANRPFGTVAGMIQYTYASIAACEGYAGSSRSGFRKELERDRVLGQLGDVLSCFDRHRTGEVLMGPAAARISNELQQVVDKLDPLPGHIADPARIRAMLAHVAKTLFVGVLNDCSFCPGDRALPQGQGRGLRSGHGSRPPRQVSQLLHHQPAPAAVGQGHRRRRGDAQGEASVAAAAGDDRGGREAISQSPRLAMSGEPPRRRGQKGLPRATSPMNVAPPASCQVDCGDHEHQG